MPIPTSILAEAFAHGAAGLAGALVLVSPRARNRVSAGGLSEAMIPRTLSESLPKLAQQLSES
jgi:hypothetical protein